MGIFLYLSVTALAYAKSFLVPIVLAFLLSLIFAPIRRYFDRRGIPSAVTSIVIVIVLMIGFFLMLGALAIPASEWVGNAGKVQARLISVVGPLSNTFKGFFDAQRTISQYLTASGPHVQKVEMQGSGLFSTVAWLAPSVLTQFIFTLVLLLFLLASGDMFYEKLVHVMPTFRDKRRAMRIAHDIERKLSRYLLTITIINACLGLVVGTLTWLIGLPTAPVFGIIAFLFNYVPYLGAVAGIALTALASLIHFHEPGFIILPPLAYFACTAIEGQIITPYFVGRSLQLNTVVVFIAVSFWAWLWSAIGMIVAVPLLVAFRTLCEHIPTLANYGDFLSERHAETPDNNAAAETE
ncbi:AI-2E family transporter [Pararhizobium mangrovi]|uniref:AI-2E family transporter n=1 Tax=Pararhizobium mangrovi TaxID=2590452 RepID=A0A506TWY9_9HYPH|nr:AI-2E family transporter [Pararhizobium mangrovi]